MTGILNNTFSLLAGFSWLTGPIFDKELRVSSRRRRYYALRSAYIALLGLFIVYTWVFTLIVGGPATPIFLASRMPEIGRHVTTTIVWFQFLAVQLLAVVLLSTSVAAEIRQRTLSVLLTTPISSLQIVAGKLLSRLLQTILLLAISLPLLAIVRLFGGVPWDYVVSSLCITLTAALLAGSLGLLLSMMARQAFRAVLTVVVLYSFTFGAVPGLLGVLAQHDLLPAWPAQTMTFLVNPFGAMLIRTYILLSIPRNVGILSSWPLHCGIMLAASAVVLSLAVWQVRRTALTAAFGGVRDSSHNRVRALGRRDDRVRRVDGSPVMWKEMRRPFFGHSKANLVAYVLLAITVAGVVGLCLFDLESGAGVVFTLASILLFFLVVRTGALAAASITREKEARSWPILLATPLEDWSIIRGKGIAAFCRNWPVFLLIAPLLLFALIGAAAVEAMGEFAILFVLGYAAMLAASFVFITGLGLYCSARMRSTSAAVAVTVGIYMVLPFVGCCALGPFLGVFFLFTGPEIGGILGYIVPVGIQAGVGLLFAWRAKCRIRHNVFQ